MEQIILLLALLVGASGAAYGGHLWATRRPRAEAAVDAAAARLERVVKENPRRGGEAYEIQTWIFARRPTPLASDEFAVPRLRELRIWVDAQIRRLEEEFPVAAK